MSKRFTTRYEKSNPFNRFDFSQESILLINGAEVYRENSGSWASSLSDLKRNYRRRLKATKDLHRLAVTDGTCYYNVIFTSENIVKEYEVIKRLKKQLEQEQRQKIVVFDGKNEKEYFRTFKIVRI